MTPIENLISRLPWSRRTGKDRWIARSPTRNDRHPSVTIRELPDGRVLIHDHGGDSVEEILAAIGMGMGDLFPPRLDAPGPGKPHRERWPFNPMDVLTVLDFEVQIVLVFAADILRGDPIEDFERLRLAVDRITTARGLYAK